MFVVFVELTLRPESRDRFIERVRQQARDSLREEKDCHVFDICVDPLRRNRVVLYEIYTNEAAFADHLASSHFRDFERDTETLVSTKKIDRLTRLEA